MNSRLFVFRLGILVLILTALLAFSLVVQGSQQFSSSSLTSNEDRGVTANSTPLAFSCNNVTEIPKIECNALVALYNSTNGTNWTNHAGWLTTSTPCSWYSVTCNTRHITELFLYNNNLNGIIPLELSNLPSLQKLNLSFNGLNGNIPAQLGNFNNLLELTLAFNQLSGSIPVELSNLSSLAYLDLTGNQLSGNLPSGLGNLNALSTLLLSRNQLSGSAPSELGNLVNLQYLYLDNNLFDGALPENLVNLTSLAYFWFQNTNLCEPEDPTFQTWLDSIFELNRTGVICAAPPSAEFDAWPQNGNAPLTVSMHIVSTANINNCAWEYGDGQTGNSCTAYHDHIYTSAGTYTIKLTVSGPGGSNTMTRNNDIVVSASPVNTPPVANNQNVTTAQNTVANITLTALDADNDPLSYLIVSSPSHGAFSSVASNVIYMPASGFSGIDSFMFKVNDGKTDSNIAIVNITITSQTPCYTLTTSVSPGNGGTVATTPSSNCQGNKYMQSTGVLLSATANPGYIFSHWSGSVSSNANPLTVAMDADKNITANFDLIASTSTSTPAPNATSTTTPVSPINTPPVANNQSVTPAQNTAKSITLTATDANNDPLTYIVVSNPSHGALSGTPPNLLYTPTGDFNGADSFTFKVNDGQADSNIATVNIAVTPSQPTTTATYLPLIARENVVETIDDLFAIVGERAPGFGGMYVDDEQDILYVYMQGGNLEAAVVALRDVFGNENLPSNVQVLQAQFSFLQLKQWHDRMAEHVFAIPGVLQTDIDDAKNLLSVGVENQEARDQVKKKLTELDIPTTAVNIEDVAPIKPDQSITDFHRLGTNIKNTAPNEFNQSITGFHRPLVGGLQIQTFFDPVNGETCTLGFIAIRHGVRGFVTNSHCSTTLAGVDQNVYYQPTVIEGGEIQDNNQIGIETVDPNGSDCFKIFKCRRSDSLFGKLQAAPYPDEEIPANLGFIALPTLNSLAWDGVSSFRIIREAPSFVGRTVTKVGRTTGRTQGVVTKIGVNTYSHIVQRLILRDQVFATYTSDHGDSGAPIIGGYFPNPDHDPVDTTLLGINWGSGKGVSVYSPIGGVEADLGRLNTCASQFNC